MTIRGIIRPQLTSRRAGIIGPMRLATLPAFLQDEDGGCLLRALWPWPVTP